MTMPFLRFDEDFYNEDDPDIDFDRPNTTPYEYSPPDKSETQFDPNKLAGVPAAARAAAISAGVRRLRVCYDGGHDEGFARADGGYDDVGRELPLPEVVARLAATPHVDAIRDVVNRPGGMNWHNGEKMYAAFTGAQVIRTGLDELGQAIAEVMLGEGFGTGEYELYGRFTADLLTGQIVDAPDAPAPDPRTFPE
jgi:hypothetical protein